MRYSRSFSNVCILMPNSDYHTKKARERQLCGILKKKKKGYKKTYLQNRNRLIDVENEQDYQLGEEG